MKNFLLLSLIPALTLAATKPSLISLVDKITNWTKILTSIFIALSVLVFIWGIALLLFSEEKRQKGKDFIIWSIIALFVLVSIWTFAFFFRKTIVGDVSVDSYEIPVVHSGK